MEVATTHHSIDVLTFNVAGLPRWIARFDGRTTHPRIGAALEPFELALIQEDFWYHDYLGASHPWQGRPRAGGMLRLGDGLARFSAYPLSSIEHVPWRVAHGLFGAFHDRWAWKGFAVGTLLIDPAHSIWVYNVHFDAGGSDGDRRARDSQREQLLADIRRRVDSGEAVIVAGDFNCGLSSLQGLMSSAGLGDAGVGGIDRVLFRSGENLTLTPGSSIELHHELPDLEPLRGQSDHAPVWVRFGVEVR